MYIVCFVAEAPVVMEKITRHVSHLLGIKNASCYKELTIYTLQKQYEKKKKKLGESQKPAAGDWYYVFVANNVSKTQY